MHKQYSPPQIFVISPHFRFLMKLKNNEILRDYVWKVWVSSNYKASACKSDIICCCKKVPNNLQIFQGNQVTVLRFQVQSCNCNSLLRGCLMASRCRLYNKLLIVSKLVLWQTNIPNHSDSKNIPYYIVKHRSRLCDANYAWTDNI